MSIGENEEAVRASLAAIETAFRITALRALADWERLGIASPDVFQSVAAMQRPSWGSWNGLLSSLRTARKNALRAATPAVRAAIEGATTLAGILESLDESLPPEMAVALEPLAAMTRKPAKRLKLGTALEMPIALRNRIAHDTPTDPVWWREAAAALKPLEDCLGGRAPLGGFAVSPPWLLESGGERRAFNGVTDDFAVVYVSGAGATRHDADRGRDVLLAFQKLLGRSDIQERDFRKLLSKLAPEDIRGVLMGDFLVGRVAGKGGFATVHVGRQLSTGRKVAVKILTDGVDEESRLRFQQEAAYLARFDHPNIVKVLGYGEEAWTAPRSFSLSGEPWYPEFSKGAAVRTFIALEWVEGSTLEDVFKGARPGPGVLTGWFLQAAEALVAVHGSGLIHRDVKPGNLMVTGDGRVKLMDFGVARSQGPERTLVTGTGSSLGTPAYMSPEQLVVRQADTDLGPQTDIYSLCATFYELFTGRRLFDHDRESDETVRTRKTRGDLPSRPSATVSGLTWELEVILMGGLRKELSDRYKTMEALASDLRHVERNEPIEFRQPSLARRAQLAYRRQRALANAAAAFAIVALAGVAAYVVSIKKEQERTEGQRQIAVQNADKERVERERADRNAASEKEQHERADETAQRETRERIRADANAAEALQRLADIYEEEGRRNLLEGQADASLVYLAQACGGDTNRPVARFLFARALEQMSGQEKNFTAHAATVTFAEFSRDGTRIVTASEDRTLVVHDPRTGKKLGLVSEASGFIRVAVSLDGTRALTLTVEGWLASWDLTKYQPLFRVRPDRGLFTASALSGDGKWMASATSDGAGEIRRTEDGFQVSELEGSKGSIEVLAFSSDGSRIVGGGRDGVVGVWDSASGKRLSSSRPLGGWVQDASLSPDGRLVLALTNTFRVFLLDSGTGAEVAAFSEGHGSHVAARFSPDGKRVVTIENFGSANLWKCDPVSHVAELSSDGHAAASAAFSADGSWVVTADSDLAGRVWSALDGKLQAVLRGHQAPLRVAAFDPTGERIVTAGEDRVARLWEWRRAPKVPMATLSGHTGAVSDLVVDAGNGRVATASMDGTARLWKIDTGECEATFSTKGIPIHSLALNHGGELLLAGCSDGTVHLWKTGRKKEVAVVHPGEDALVFPEPLGGAVVDFSPDGTRFAAGDNTGSVGLFDVRGERAHEPWKDPGAVVRLRFSRDGTRLLTAGRDGGVSVREVSSGRTVAQFQAHTGEINTAEFSPDGRSVLTCGDDGFIGVFAASDGQTRFLKSAHAGAVASARFDSEGTKIVSAGRDGTARIWAADTGELVAVLDNALVVPSPGAGKGIVSPEFNAFLGSLSGESEASVRGAVFSRDSRLVVTMGRGPWIRVWDAAKSRLLVQFEGGNQNQDFAAFSEDGNILVTAGDAGTVRIWDMRPDGRTKEQLAAEVQERIPLRLIDGRLLPADSPGDPAEKKKGGPRPPVDDDHGMRVPPDSPAGKFAERGRTALAAGDSGEAVSWLSQALNESEQDGTLRLLAGQAFRQLRSGCLRLKGDPAVLSGAAFSPDGTRLATGDTKGEVRIWEASTGCCLAVCEEPGKKQILTLGFGGGGNLIAGAGADRKVRVWDCATAKKILETDGHIATISPDGRHIATAQADGGVVLLDLPNGKQTARIDGFKSLAFHISFTPDGTRILTASMKHRLALWDAATGALLKEFSGLTEDLADASLSPDGTRVFALDQKGVARIWDPSGDRDPVVFQDPKSRIVAASWSAGGDRIATASGSSAQLWDAATGKSLETLRGHDMRILSAVCSPDGKHLAMGYSDGVVAIQDTAGGRSPRKIPSHQSQISRVLFDPAGGRLLSLGVDTVARLWPAAGPGVYQLLDSNKVADRVAAFSDKGTRLAWGGKDGVVHVQALAGEARAAELGAPGSPIRALAWIDEDRLAVASEDRKIRVWQAGEATLAREFEGEEVRFLRMKRDEPGVLLGAGAVGIYGWEISSGRRVFSRIFILGLLDPLATADGRWLIGGDGYQFVVCDARTGESQPLPTKRGLHGPLALSADSSRLVAIGPGGMDFYEAPFQHKPRHLKLPADPGAMGEIASVAFHPAGAVVATGSGDGKVAFWDTVRSVPLFDLALQNGSVDFLAFSPDASRLLTISSEGEVRLWDITPENRTAADVLKDSALLSGWRVSGDKLVESEAPPSEPGGDPK